MEHQDVREAAVSGWEVFAAGAVAKRRLKQAGLYLSLPRSFFHVLAYLSSPRRDVIDVDLEVWMREYELDGSPVLGLHTLLTRFPEYRNLFYYRVKPLSYVLRLVYPPLPTLRLNAAQIGPGLFVQHGEGARVNGERIGAYCWINQQVTIGYSNKTDRPTLEDHVRVGPGARIFGAVTVGEGTTVGSNAVIVKDVPPNCTVVGVYPAYIVRENGERANRRL
jgi:serine O-acetyltransferase